MRILLVALVAVVAWAGIGYYYYAEADGEARSQYYARSADCRSGRGSSTVAGRCEEYYYRYRAGDDDRMIEAAMVGLSGPVLVLAIAGLFAFLRRRNDASEGLPGSR